MEGYIVKYISEYRKKHFPPVKMDNQDDWMRKYITKHRMQFINNLSELFIQGFPGLHNSLRNRITCRWRQDGYVIANGELLDCILRIDDFPRKFIEFCENNDCTPELARIMLTGIGKYQCKEAYQRHQGILPSISQAVKNNQGSTDCEAAEALFHRPNANNESDLRVTINNNTASSENANAMNEDTNEIHVAHDEIDQKRDTTSSEGSADMLLRQLQSIIPNCENEKETDENCDNSNAGEQECTTISMVCMHVDNKQSLSNAAQQITQCPCPYHINKETSLPFNNEIQMSKSFSDIQKIPTNNLSDRQYNNELTTDTTIQVCDSNNMNTDDPIKKTYGTKMTVTEENIASGVSNKTNVTNDKQNDKKKSEIAFSSVEKCDNLDENKDDASDASDRQNSRLSLQHPELEDKGKCTSSAGQEEADSSRSYYLTSSDEENLSFNKCDTHEIETKHVYFEIENLKLPALINDCSEEQVQNSDKVMTNGLFNTIPKEIKRFEPSKTSEMIFIKTSTTLSGIQCQEDIERNKNEISNSEKKERVRLINQSNRNTYTESSVTRELANDDSFDFETFDNLVSSVSSETHSLEIPTPEIVNIKQRAASNKKNIGDIILDRKTQSYTQTDTSILNQTRAQDNSVLTAYPNNASDHSFDLPEPHQDRTNNDNIECGNNGSQIPIQETAPSTMSYLFDNIYTPMRNVVHNFFPELRVWF